ncbi:ABC transporter substrate-binding protein [Paenibacillus piri]|uniref:Sugar ABC transporter substrate-binding protein n=1 Tax=Paenibacillus piri TaxID=2547395 RepID=A0A4R5KV76_9BACL|nr:sugar ABC transporter substrate-binding protein [Paenibacillus piri]TDF98850.1 sugar ABC transporter substrate-binding protein [Paenibacillus piri]
MKKGILKSVSAMLLVSTVMAGCTTNSDGTQNAANENQGGANDGKKSNVTINLATVNNPDMTIMQKLAPKFTEETGIGVNFIVLPENELRNKLTTAVGMGAGTYDLATIGTFEVPHWGDNKWLEPLDPYFEKMDASTKKEYNRDDIMKPIVNALSSKSGLYALPFYAESTMMFYRKDLFEAKGLTMPKNPTWDQVYEMAVKLNEPAKGVTGVCMRGLPGWGQNMFIFTQMLHTFGGKWFDMNWNPQFSSPEMKEALQFYKKLITDAGEPSPNTTGYTECLNLMSTGKAAMWVDATVSGGTLMSGDSQVKDKIGYALAPIKKKPNFGAIGGWSLAMMTSSKQKDAAFKFLTWSTSQKYIEMVGNEFGWERAPSGTRISTYENPKYLAAAPFAKITLDSINNADYEKPAIDPVPYKSSGWVSIPEYQEIGDQVGQEFGAYLAGTKSLDQMLKDSQNFTVNVMKRGGYLK